MDKLTIKKKLRGLREFLRMTQREFAEKVGVSQANVSQWEDPSGVLPSLKTYSKIQEMFPDFFNETKSIEGGKIDESDRFVRSSGDEYDLGKLLSLKEQVASMKEKIENLEAANRELKEDKEFLKNMLNKKEGE